MSNDCVNDVKYDTTELTINEQERELNFFRTMYYQLNAKPDSMSKAFSRKVIITRDNIIELNKQVLEKIRLHYHDDGFIATITANLSNKQVLNFNCWEEFVNYDWIVTQCINSIILKWNFNIRMPQYEYPQNHTLIVKLSNGLGPGELLSIIFSGKIEDIDEIETNAFPVIARVDFIEPILGEELLNIVSKWVDGLKHTKSKSNVFILFMQKYRKRTAQYFNYFSFIMVAILGGIVINNLVQSFNVVTLGMIQTSQFMELFNLLIIYFIILFLSLKLFEGIAEKVYENLTKYGQNFIFNITKGDKEKQEEIDERNHKNGKKIILQFICSIVFNVLCGVISGLLV